MSRSFKYNAVKGILYAHHQTKINLVASIGDAPPHRVNHKKTDA